MQNLHRTVTNRSCNSKRHCYSVIQMRINGSSMQWFPSMNDHTIICSLYISTHTLQIFNHNCNTVRFFNFEFLCITDNSCSISKSCHNRNHWNFIDQCRNNSSLNCGSLKVAGANQKIGSRFTFCTLIQKGDVSAHIHTHLKHSGSCWIDPDIFQQNFASWSQKSGCDKICC